MATKPTTRRSAKLDAARPLYAVVGAGELAVAFARTAATDVQARMAKVELEPEAIRAQAATLVSTRVEELQDDAKRAQALIEARLAELQVDARALPAKLEKLVNDSVAGLSKGYAELADRGQGFVTKVRKQEATQETVAAAKTTAAKAKSTRTQATSTARTTRSSAKATGTAAKKTASAAKKAGATAAGSAGT